MKLIKGTEVNLLRYPYFWWPQLNGIYGALMWLKIGQLPQYFRSIALSSNGCHASASFGLKHMD